MTFARILGITVATAVIVFLGLTILSPRHHEEKVLTAGVTPDQVFGAAATPPAPGETPAAVPADASNPAVPAASASATAPTPAPGDTSAAASAPAPASPQQGLSDEEARKIAEDVGRKVATRVVEEKSSPSAASTAPAAEPAARAPAEAESAPAVASSETASSPSSGAGTSLTESDVRRIAAEEARRVYAQNGGTSGGTSHPKKATPKPAADETASAGAPAEAAPAPAPAEKSVAKHHKMKKAVVDGMAGDLPATDAITAWWLTTDKQLPDHLNLVYAGSTATEKSAVLLFSDPVDAGAASSHLQLFSTDGKPVSGSWEASPSNPRMLLFKNLAPGRYTVVITPDITAASGKTITSGLHGPIYIR